MQRTGLQPIGNIIEAVTASFQSPQDQKNSPEAEQSYEAELAREEFARKLSAAGIGKRFFHAKLIDVRDIRGDIADYLDHIQDNVKHGKGLLILGSIGVGKTSIFSVIAKHCIWNFPSISILCVAAYDLATHLAHPSDNGEAITIYKSVDLLLVDDFGSEYIHDWPMSGLSNLIDTRWREMLATCITTNISKDRLSSQEFEKVGRMIDRWRDSSAFTVLEITGESRRQ